MAAGRADSRRGRVGSAVEFAWRCRERACLAGKAREEEEAVKGEPAPEPQSGYF